MADSVDIRVTGLPAFSERLKELSMSMQRKIVRAGGISAGKVFKKAAIANAPVLKARDTRKIRARVPGALKKAIVAVRSKRLSKPGMEVIAIAALTGGKNPNMSKSAFYWRFVEDGHLTRGKGQAIKGGKKRAGLERTRLKAGGAKFVPGVHYIARAFKENQDAAIKAFNERIEARIVKAQRDLNVR
jgi:HK97 gp10 family phage protein